MRNEIRDIRKLRINAECRIWNVKLMGFLFLITTTLAFTACTKVIDVNIPDSTQKVVVDGSIENGVPPILLLTKSQKFFGTVNLNDLAGYFVHGANINVTGSDGTQTLLQEFCLQSLALSPDQQQLVLNSLGFSTVDSANIPNVCVYTVPDIVTYFLGGTPAFVGHERTTYNLDIVSPPLHGNDSVHLTSSAYIPTAVGMDSLSLREHSNPAYRDSMEGVDANVSVPDTFGNFLRYKTKRNSEPFYAPSGGSVWDDKLFVGLHIRLPVERGQAPGAEFDINTDTYFWKGDTVTVKWSNIDSHVYDFFYTLENDGGSSPFGSPVKIKTNINNGLGIWAGYATKYYNIIIPR